ncbi:c-type cytochrome [Gilvimarinus sp. F26214L]|uniref:c-type cytochrome n=1 Tax=Gilvimarinus sp. DZF01 TaxID=3461371 RepID=UPI0040466168
MKNFTKAATILLGLFSLAHGAQVLAQGNAEAGAEKTAVCAACHGADGNSGAAIYPKLAGLGEKYLYKQLEDIKSGARVVPEMTGMLNPLSEQDLRDVAAYYAEQTLQLAGAQEATVKLNSGDETDALALGRTTYRFGNPETGVPACSGCHSPTGVGNAPAGYPRLGGQFADYISKQLQAFRLGERTNDEQQVMRQVAEHMSEAEITAVSNYIAGLYAGEGNSAAQ